MLAAWDAELLGVFGAVVRLISIVADTRDAEPELRDQRGTEDVYITQPGKLRPRGAGAGEAVTAVLGASRPSQKHAIQR